jgi:glutamate dehydrogenase/leucine dehydrogenase
MPGVNAGTEVMGWISSEHSSLQAGSPATTIGRPVGTGGLAERDAIMGRALATLILRVAHDCGKPISGLRIALQASDQSGIHAALSLVNAGCNVVAMGQEGMCARNASGLDIERIARQVQREGAFGSLQDGFDEIYRTECDVLAISAPECTLSSNAANQVHATIVVETSELVITPNAERALLNRGVMVIPDLISAAGAVFAANAEWTSIVQKTSPSPAAVEGEIEASLIRIYQQAQERSGRENISLRMAAYCSAIERVARCERLRVA